MKWKLGEYRDLRNLNEVTMLGKPYYLLYIPIMVTKFKFLNSNPGKGIHRASGHRRGAKCCVRLDKRFWVEQTWVHRSYTGALEFGV